jgi:hypothetical protein
MRITIESPDGPRVAVTPFEGITDEATLIKALVLTIAIECSRGVEDLMLNVDFTGADPERLVSIAREFRKLTFSPSWLN